jgi:hypothetical protein
MLVVEVRRTQEAGETKMLNVTKLVCFHVLHKWFRSAEFSEAMEKKK